MIKTYIFLLLLVVAIIAFVIYKKLTETPDIYPYQKKKYFLTRSERVFFEILLQIINNQYFIFPQVHIASVLEVKKGQANYMSFFNKIIRKSFDFVIFDKQNLNALLVIELDDSSHSQPKRIERDEFVNEAVKVSDLNILHIKPQKNYNVQELKQLIFSHLDDKAPVLNPIQKTSTFKPSQF